MITIIMLTVIALAVLLIGFFEIRIPFIHQKNSARTEEWILNYKGRKEAKTGGKKIKHLLKDAKSQVSYRIAHERKTSDIA